ncbi:uncharacterized protein RB166_007067 [Leptodactylus fuscus]|uniref:uncharacterized protein LOC142201205 n=1 Tax=Leptodactylus fuscus TaxID=238119 RepID=UPI003F4E5EF2
MKDEKAAPLAVYKMCLENDRNTKRWKFTNGHPEINNKVIMMIGETGSGKTTLVNALANYMFGVQWKHDCRIQLLAEDPMMTQDPHQGSKIMVYQINHEEKFCIPNSLTIIDTPELPKRQSVTPKKTAIQQIRQLFYDSELDHIDAICFVTQPSMSALSPTQKFVFDSLSAMFGSKIQDNIVTFMTSTEDDQRPPALAAIIQENVPCAKDRNGYPVHFTFTTSVLYADNSPDAGATSEQQWILGMENLNNFFKFLSNTSRKNIVLEKSNLERSNAIEITVDALVHRIEEVMSKQHELEEIKKILRRQRVQVEQDEGFEFAVNRHMKKKIKTMGNCTNCHECESTCHHHCIVAYDMLVRLCEVFYLNAVCRVCGHGSSRHFSEKFLWQNLVVYQKVTYRSIKMKYKRDDEEELTYEMVLERVEAEIQELRKQGTQLLLRATDHIKQVTSIRSSTEFIDQLVETERQKRKCGYQGRIEMLEKAKSSV